MASTHASSNRSALDEPPSSRSDSDHFRPTGIVRDPITIGDNPAHVEGVMYEEGRFYACKGLFQALFRDRAVLLTNGKMALDSYQPFGIFGSKDRYHRLQFRQTLCPPTDSRINS